MNAFICQRLCFTLIGVGIVTEFFAVSACAQSGYQTINGTRVYTVVDQARGVATFSNDCGSQTLTQRQLQAGAIPSNIIPCPRSRGHESGCQAGYVLAPSGGCMKAGSVDCGNHTSCPGGTICAKGNECLDITSKRVCGDLKHYCDQDYECRTGNICEPPFANTADEAFEEGKREFAARNFSAAEIAFSKASSYYWLADMNESAAIAKKELLLATCHRRTVTDKNDASALRLWANGECKQHTEVAEWMKRRAAELEAAKKSEAETSPAAASTSGSSRTIASQGPPGSPPTVRPPTRTNTQNTSCSDITGTNSSSPGPKCRPELGIGLGCPQRNGCDVFARWTSKRPYNQASEPVVFFSFLGDSIVIPPGYSLWSMPASGASTRRKLEAHKWSGEPKSDQKNCAQEYTTATVREFEVDIRCELDRQMRLRRDFIFREDTSDYMNIEQCRPPAKVRMNTGWERKSLQYWKAHPDEPVGWCDIPAKDGRTDTKKIRQPNWLPGSQCEILQPSATITVSSRGVRGCLIKSQ